MFPADMPLDASTLTVAVAALAATAIALVLWVALLQRSVSSVHRRLRRALPDGSGTLDEVLERTLDRVDQLTQRVDALNALHRELQEVTRRSVQKVGVVRFNPFADSGGDQSFAIALLDSNGTGVVISSLHGRTETRIFAKHVLAGRSRHQLSEEEQDAIRRALAPADVLRP